MVAEPAQLAPPLAGAGSLHCLVLVRTPVPQLTEQVPSSNGDQLPSTVKIKKNPHHGRQAFVLTQIKNLKT